MQIPAPALINSVIVDKSYLSNPEFLLCKMEMMIPHWVWDLVTSNIRIMVCPSSTFLAHRKHSVNGSMIISDRWHYYSQMPKSASRQGIGQCSYCSLLPFPVTCFLLTQSWAVCIQGIMERRLQIQPISISLIKLGESAVFPPLSASLLWSFSGSSSPALETC